MSRSFKRSVRERVRDEQDAWLFAVMFVAVLLLGLTALALLGDMFLPPDVAHALALAAVALAAIAPPTVRRFFWHILANQVGVAPARLLAQPWVVDGDTIDDRADGVRYRVANIDAPETGEDAKCFKERQRGETAKAAAIQLVRNAQRVEVRQTWRIDRYGRRIAFVIVDGIDLGSLLVKRGLARPWRGQRERWCGKNGGLARIARAGAAPHACMTCETWRG